MFCRQPQQRRRGTRQAGLRAAGSIEGATTHRPVQLYRDLGGEAAAVLEAQAGQGLVLKALDVHLAGGRQHAKRGKRGKHEDHALLWACTGAG